MLGAAFPLRRGDVVVAPALAQVGLVVDVLLDLEVATLDVERVLRVDLNGREQLPLVTLALSAMRVIQKQLPDRHVVRIVVDRRPREALHPGQGLFVGKVHAGGQRLAGLLGLRDQLLVHLDDLLVEVAELRVDRQLAHVLCHTM